MTEEQGDGLTIAVFEGTTHQRYWIFTQERLAELRAEANETACADVNEWTNKLRRAGSEEQQPDVVLGPSPGKKARTECEESGVQVDCITLQEEQIIQDYYLEGVFSLSNKLKLPANVETTAITFYKRFYLYCSAMDYHPKDIMFTVLWVACKVEHYPSRYINAQKVVLNENSREFSFDAPAFADHGNIPIEHLLRLEQVLLQVLKYHLMVHHPFRPLRGFLEMWTKRSDSMKLADDVKSKIEEKATKLLRDWMKSDILLILHPSEIALCALRHTCAKAKMEAAFDMFLKDAIGSSAESVGRVYEAIEGNLAAHKQRLKGEQLKTEATRINAKLQGCSNPEKERSHPQFALLEEIKRKEREAAKEAKNLRIAQEQREQEMRLLGIDGGR
ncbi:hypothetical protein GUITHDRAFT_162398 [Guillardia theta CCMP2712]|uniref:Cyclin-like domain-containing protein n=2 Tax=Guillardia theta TaxID=55529 RepID=L1JJA4_GUITC|nr:hypothetical protein GUITHDRAFT_162398 [Guillardia theta CCMP2712]EKX48581.1 hypothetical protein GUITHDRAFT_162398 [Guillardia theta CCMP2712]|eukprot:XP_005835561.1 hypothetical protein GUITHDRAFT_162398 [Guillardia theta CCMP2712]